ncbi:MAG: 4Fe-4S binding protein [Deltaproteobacteria bacterium]|nr:4Fe-4S binding protein [Deltaproteobacteria bacterium]
MHVIGKDCDKCGFCILECPVEAIVDAGPVNRVVPEKCVECGACVPVCPLQVIVEEHGAINDAAAPAVTGR